MDRSPRRALTFVVVTLSVSWLLAFGYFAVTPLRGTVALLALGAPYIFIPAAVAVVLQRFVYGEGLVEPLRIGVGSRRWLVVAWAVPAVMALVILGLSLLPREVSFSWGMDDLFERYSSLLTPEQIYRVRAQVAAMPIHPFWVNLVLGIVGGATVNAVVSLGEELGWRGFLLRHLEGYGFWRASVVIGAVWGLWHAPFVLHGINYPHHPMLGVGLMTLSCILFSPPMVYVTLRARSVLAAAIFHGVINGTSGLVVAVLAGGSELTAGITGWPGFVGYGCLNVLLFFYDQRFPALPTASCE
ncbi:MAG: CPBP family intramembrane glutamic endopeptidase [FCB group bacterium]|jgi:membrane protease YdiL (CAAX protease family)|nr:CPBP family intramembrane glutamic endopeptidase [FCB group bacterium]